MLFFKCALKQKTFIDLFLQIVICSLKFNEAAYDSKILKF